jgi:hypothetical protein
MNAIAIITGGRVILKAPQIVNDALNQMIMEQLLAFEKKADIFRARLLRNTKRAFKTCVVFDGTGNRVLISKQTLTEDIERCVRILSKDPKKSRCALLFFNAPLEQIAELLRVDAIDAFPDLCDNITFDIGWRRYSLENVLVSNMGNDYELLLRILKTIRYKRLDLKTFEMVLDEKLRLGERIIAIKMARWKPTICNPRDANVQVIVGHNSVTYKEPKIENKALNQMIRENFRKKPIWLQDCKYAKG